MSLLSDIFNTIFPATCACCGEVLVDGEKQICVNCISNLEETSFSPIPDNHTERTLLGRIHICAATAIYRYGKSNTTRKVVHAMKFHNNPELCIIMGRQMGLRLLGSGRFDDVDLLVPVPLHWFRRIKRGYNQSELLCRGIAEVMPRPICTDAIVRHRYTKKQSRSKAKKRFVNVEGAFRVREPAMLEGKHILLVDDVLTTGATLTACADAIAKRVNDIRISVATLSEAL